MTDPAPRCTHPWLRVTCGSCGEAVDALGEPTPRPAEGGPVGGRLVTRENSQALFIVARGHPELVEQLRAVMGYDSGVEIIEDRRRHPREAEPGAPSAGESRAELRKLLRAEGEPDQG
jgi:hypothetical protein